MDRLKRLGKYTEFQERVCTGFYGPIIPQIPYLDTPASIEMTILLMTFLSFLMTTFTFACAIYFMCMDNRKPMCIRLRQRTTRPRPILKRTNSTSLNEVISYEPLPTNGSAKRPRPTSLPIPPIMTTDNKIHEPTPAPSNTPIEPSTFTYTAPKPIPIKADETCKVTKYVSPAGAMGRTGKNGCPKDNDGGGIKWVYTRYGAGGSERNFNI